jgi:hypothetical protein
MLWNASMLWNALTPASLAHRCIVLLLLSLSLLGIAAAAHTSTMSGLLELIIPSNGSEFSLIGDITFALPDWAIKEKFSFRRAKSSGVSWVCATREKSGCQWKVRGEVQKC